MQINLTNMANLYIKNLQNISNKIKSNFVNEEANFVEDSQDPLLIFEISKFRAELIGKLIIKFTWKLEK